MFDVVVQEVTPPNAELLEQIGRLRVRAWATVVEEAAQMEVWLDEFDASARHWIVTVNGELAAAARMSVHNSIGEVPEAEIYLGLITDSLPKPIASINRLVVSPDHRRRGYARLLDCARIAAAEKSGYGCIVAETPSGAGRVRALLSHGFKFAGTSQRGSTFAPDGAIELAFREPPAVLFKVLKPTPNRAHRAAVLSI